MTYKFNPDLDRRRSIRIPGHDYARGSAVFVTICTYQREPVLSDIVRGAAQLSEEGRIAEECWLAIPEHLSDAQVDAFVVMPNHVHGILILAGREPLMEKIRSGPPRASIGAIVGAFKSATSRRVNELRATPAAPLWQRNYFEHVISNAEELAKVRAYIAANPANWTSDEFYPLLRARPLRTP